MRKSFLLATGAIVLLLPCGVSAQAEDPPPVCCQAERNSAPAPAPKPAPTPAPDGSSSNVVQALVNWIKSILGR